jgi:hypothetical protein
MLRRATLVRTDVSNELSASIIRVIRIGELGTTLAITSNQRSVLSYSTNLLLFHYRLEKMRRAMGSGQRKQEVLIQTSTGFFRFQGISEKFTRRLYEWEKAKGIGPEASTFALLDPGYRPSSDGSSSAHGKVQLLLHNY